MQTWGGPQGECIPPPTHAVTHCKDVQPAVHKTAKTRHAMRVHADHTQRHLVRYPQFLEYNSSILASKPPKQHSMCLPKPWPHTMAETYDKCAASGRTAQVLKSRVLPALLTHKHMSPHNAPPNQPGPPSSPTLLHQTKTPLCVSL